MSRISKAKAFKKGIHDLEEYMDPLDLVIYRVAKKILQHGGILYLPVSSIDVGVVSVLLSHVMRGTVKQHVGEVPYLCHDHCLIELLR